MVGAILKVFDCLTRMLLISHNQQGLQTPHLYHLNQQHILVRVLLMYVQVVVLSVAVNNESFVHYLALADLLVENRI